MLHKMLQPLEVLDIAMIRLFQRITDQSGVSNYRWGEVCCWLSAASALMWVEQVLSIPALIWYVFASTFYILGIFILRSWEKAGDSSADTVWIYMWRDFYLCRAIRALIVISFACGFGDTLLKLSSFRLADWMLAGHISLLIPIVYFSACTPPTYKPRKPDRNGPKKVRVKA